MREWSKPKLSTLNVDLTSSGGSAPHTVDKTWTTYDGDVQEDHTTYS